MRVSTEMKKDKKESTKLIDTNNICDYNTINSSDDETVHSNDYNNLNLNKITNTKTAQNKVKNFILNTEEYWAIYFSFIWYGIILIVTYSNLNIPRFPLWVNRTDINSNINVIYICTILILILLTLLMLSISHKIMSKKDNILQYLSIFIICIICRFIGSNKYLHDLGFGGSIWCILMGIVYRNIMPQRLYEYYENMYNFEFFVKIGIGLLVIDTNELFKTHGRELIVSWLETVIIICIIYSIGTYLLKMLKFEALITACGSGICGSSAVLTISSVIDIDKKLVSSLITIMSVLTIPLIPTLPLIAKYYGHIINDRTVGALIGGSVDSTNAVLASASLATTSDEVLKTAIVIKMLQSMLIAPVAVFIVIIYKYINYKSSDIENNNPKQTDSNNNITNNIKEYILILLDKFPKFILVFIILCFVTTYITLDKDIETRIINNSISTSEWFSSFSFVLLGLNINLGSLKSSVMEYKKVCILYIIGQLIDICTTFGTAYFVYNTNIIPI